MLAYLLDPLVADVCNSRLRGETDTMKLKLPIYRKYFLLEPRKKYHGFENVLHLDDALRPELRRLFGSYDGVAKTSYADLVAGLSHEQQGG